MMNRDKSKKIAMRIQLTSIRGLSGPLPTERASRTIFMKEDRRPSPLTMALYIYIGLYLFAQLDWYPWVSEVPKMPNTKISGYWHSMAPQALVPISEAVAVIKLFIDHFRTNAFPRWSDGVWQEMSDTLKRSGFRWSSDCVFTNVTCDRRDILTLARKEMGIKITQSPDCNDNMDDETKQTNDDAEESNVSDIAESFEEQPKNLNSSIKILFLTENEWTEIKPDDADDKIKLKPQVWTNVIDSAMWNQYRMPCAFIFKRSDVRKSSDTYIITFVGQCKSKKCQNNIKGRAEKQLEGEEGVTFTVETRDTRGDVGHEVVKRPFNGKRRKEAYKDLKTQGCAKYRKCEARKLMLPGDIEPAALASNAVYRQAKKEGIDKDLGIDKREGRDIVRSIEDMSLSPRYCGFIREVAGYPFHVIYGSRAQLHVYQEYRRLNRNSYTIAVDATGSLVNRLQRKNGTKSSHIFLYAIVINCNGTTASVYQMLSEHHDSVTIMTWLLRWIQSGAPAPREAVCDYSRALLMGMSMAFNKQPIKQYINDRFQAVSSSSGIPKAPITYIRIDVAHFTKMVCRWKSFQNANQRAIKDFFVRCVALMVECHTLEKFKQVFLLTCTVALQSHEDSIIDLEEARTPKDARIKLEQFISRGKVADESTSYEEEEKRDVPFRRKFVDGESDDDGEAAIDGTDEQNTCIGKWIDGLLAKTRKTVLIGQNLNPFYLPDFIDRFTLVAKEFILWTAVGMPPGTKRASSCHVEGSFKDLKKSMLNQYTLPISADKFVREHARDIEGANCIISGKMVQQNNDRLYKNNIDAKKDLKVTKCEIEKSIEDSVDSEKVVHVMESKIVECIEDSVDSEKVVHAMESKIVESIENSTDLPSIDMQKVVDSDLFAVENWRGKGEIFEKNDCATGCDTDHETPTDLPIIDRISPVTDQAGLIDRMDIDVDGKSRSEFYFDHTYCQLNDNHQELIYDDFITSLNQRVDPTSTCIDFASIDVEPTIKQPARPAKYFKPYPEICQQNARVFDEKNTQLKAALLQNGSRCGKLVMEGRTYVLRNTCAFDSIIQILATAAIDNLEYRHFLQNSENETLKFVCNFIEKGVSKSLLIARAKILAKYCTPKPQGMLGHKVISYEIDAEENIVNTLKHTLSSHPSIEDVEECSVCPMRTTTRITIAPNHKMIARKGFRALQEALQFWSPYYNVMCRDGCSGKYTRTSTPAEHIFIELDVRDGCDLKKSIPCSLGDFPITMHLGQKSATSYEYRLAGVVEHLPGHYIAHCLRTGGYWQKFNDMDRKTMPSTAKTRIEPHLAIYIRKNIQR